MDLIAGRYEPVPEDADGIRNPARDTISGELVTVLRAPAPVDALPRFQELDRLRRYAALRRPHLAEVLAVELRGGEVQVVCRALPGGVLGSPPPGLPVTAVRRIAADLLDAVAELHLTGVVRGWLPPDAVLLHSPPGAAADARVTLLPMSLTGAPRDDSGDDDDRARAATLLLRLLRRVPVAAAEDDALADDLGRALERMGGTDDESWGPPRSGLVLPAPVSPPAPPVALAHSADSLVAPPPAAAGSSAAVPVPGRSPRPRRTGARRRLRIGAVVLVVAAVATGAALAGGHHGGRTQAAPTRPAASGTPVPAATSSPGTAIATAPPTPSPAAIPTPWDMPATVPALADVLAARPDAAGPSGGALLDTLHGLTSGDGTVVQQSAYRLVSLALDDPGVDPRFGAAGLVALATSPLPGAPGAAPSCFGTAPGTPDPHVQQHAQEVLDRVAGWQAQGLPADRAERLRALAAPVAAAQAVPVLAACPAG